MDLEQETQPAANRARKQNGDHLLGYALGRSDAKQGLHPDPHAGPASTTFRRGYIEGYCSVSQQSSEDVATSMQRVSTAELHEHESVFQSIVDRELEPWEDDYE